MSKKNRSQREQLNNSFEGFSFGKIFKLFAHAFIFPFFRLAKKGICLKSNMPLGNIIIDCVCVLFVCGMLEVFGQSKIIGWIALYFFMCYLIGISRIIRENNSQKPIEKPEKNQQNVNKKSPKNNNQTTKSVKDIAGQSYIESTDEQVNEWLEKNPDLKIINNS